MLELTEFQIIQAVEEMQKSVVTLREQIMDAKARQVEATKDIKRIEKDMKEFSSNKDSKLAELEASLEKLKKVLIHCSASIKPVQQELREYQLDLDQCSSDLSTAQESFQETELSVKTQQDEVAELEVQQKRSKVRKPMQRVSACR